MSDPIHIAAIDAGSNAIRIAIARAEGPYRVRILHTERRPVRLGHRVFTRRQLDKKTMARAVKVFRRFARLMERHKVSLHGPAYRAVATSATRESRNRREFLARVRRKTGLRLELVGGAEEARLVVGAVLHSLSRPLSPRMVVDLGGGSLQINLVRGGQVEFSRALPLGAVRLLESFQLSGALTTDQVVQVRNFVLAVLGSSFRRAPDLSGELAVACGGNAEALARIAPGPPVAGIPTINMRLLRERLWDILRLDLRKRMKQFGVRADRADVISVAAIVLITLARWMGVRSFLVPGVGVREGVLRELVQAHFAEEISAAEEKKAAAVGAAVRRFVARHESNTRHDEHVCRLALALFDQLAPVHHMGLEQRRLLEWGALLHDAGHFVSRKQHHRHGEYLVRHGKIPGLKGWRRNVVACLVRYHNNKSSPGLDHKLYAALDPLRRRHVRGLAAILRIAEGLDRDHRLAVAGVEVVIHGLAPGASRRKQVELLARVRGSAAAVLQSAARKAELFEREFGVRVDLRPVAPRKARGLERRRRVA